MPTSPLRFLALSLLALLLAACTPEAPQAPAGTAAGREETRTIRNTEAIGYDGAAIAQQVDGALDAADQRSTALQAVEDAAD